MILVVKKELLHNKSDGFTVLQHLIVGIVCQILLSHVQNIISHDFPLSDDFYISQFHGIWNCQM